MNKKIILVCSFLANSICAFNDHHQAENHQYTTMTKEQYIDFKKTKDEQIKYLQDSLTKNEASETGFTKTNIGLSAMAAGIVILVVGMSKGKNPVIAGGALTLGAGGFTAYTASNSRRES